LEWDTFNTDEVIPEYSVESKRVDFSLAIDRRNEVFIEVKRPDQELERHEKQLLDYSFQEGVDLALLTNGLIYWFYLPTAKGPWTKRKFYTIDILAQDPHEVGLKFIDIFSRQNVASGNSITECRRIYESRLKKSIILETLPESWNRMVSEPDSLLIDMLSETTERLCGFKPEDASIRKFLSKYRDQFSITEVTPKRTPSPLPRKPPKSVTEIAGKKVEIVLNTIYTPKKYSLIPLPKKIRSFFPGYKIPFILETDIGQIETKVTSAPKGTEIGNPQAGNYIQGGLKPWYDRHNSLSEGAILNIHAIEPGKRYKLAIQQSK